MIKEHKDIKIIAKEVRQELKKEFPKCVFSVQIERYSMGQSMTVSLMKSPFQVFKESLNNFDLDFVQGVTDVPKEKIAEAARCYAANKPAAIIPINTR